MARVVDGVRRDDAGAVVVFLGSVRADAGVRALDYEVYVPMAEKALAVLVEGAKSKFEVLEMSIVHRVGRVPVREDSVVTACSWAMDEVKRIVPIWKTESSAMARRAPSRRNRRA